MKFPNSTDEWAYEIGKVMLAFGDIESVANQCLRCIPSDNIYDALVKSYLSPKLDLIVAFTKGRTPNSISLETSTEFIELIERIKKVLVYRNLIAHNPLSLGVYEDDEGNLVDYREEIRSLHKEARLITLQDIKNLSKNIRNLANDFHKIYAKVNHEVYKFLP